MRKKIAIVQAYIHLRKNLEVNISIRSIKDVMLLDRAYNIAIDWFKVNNIKISLI